MVPVLNATIPYAGEGSSEQVLLGLLTLHKRNTLRKESLAGLSLQSLTWILAMLKTDSKCYSHR